MHSLAYQISCSESLEKGAKSLSFLNTTWGNPLPQSKSKPKSKQNLFYIVYVKYFITLTIRNPHRLMIHCLRYKVSVGCSTQQFSLSSLPDQPPPEAQKVERRPMKATRPYLSWLVSITRLTEGDSVKRACTFCWPETRETSFPESCPAPVESSCLF